MKELYISNFDTIYGEYFNEMFLNEFIDIMEKNFIRKRVHDK